MSFIGERRSQVKAVVQIPVWSKIYLSSFVIFFFFYLYSFRCFQSKNNVWRIWKGLNQWLRKKFKGKRKKTNNSFRSKIQFIICFKLLVQQNNFPQVEPSSSLDYFQQGRVYSSVGRKYSTGAILPSDGRIVPFLSRAIRPSWRKLYML